MTTKRLTDEHPTHKKVERLVEFMEREGISLSFGRHGDVFVVDHQRPAGTVYRLQDVDSPSDPGSEFPPATEWKLTHDE